MEKGVKAKEIIECLIEYSQMLLKEYHCHTNTQFLDSEKIKFFLINKKVAFEYVIDLTNDDVRCEFEKMVDDYKEKCTKWCGKE